MPTQRPEVGPRIRSARQQRQLSLADVAERAGVSVATLSRIETSKQAIDVELLVTIAGVLGVPPAQLLPGGDGHDDFEFLADRVAALRASDRARLMQAAAARRRRTPDPGAVIDDLMSALDMIRDELEQVAHPARKRRRR